MSLRQPGLPSGLSVDAAWRYGTGKPNILLAILDDGIDGLEPELTHSIALNLGELLYSPPLTRNHTPCAPLIAGDPTSPRFDCAVPADGEVTLEDFADTLGWSTGNENDRYDPNGNGVLDLYDVAQHYQNQKDDDNNGLVDDILGWNFIESSPMPDHGALRHGTESALDALASTNDNVGRAGVCPGCRLIPIRTADQRGSDPQRLALGILYAASRGATAALVGHLPRGRSETLERAIQTAAQRGTLVLFPQDGEQLSQAPLLFNLDAWLPIGGITTRSDYSVSTLTTSFVALDPCQTYAPGINYVGAGPSCGRTASSIVLGIAGLVASGHQVALDKQKLSALELASLLKWSADPIDTGLTSTSNSVPIREAEVRRINANAAVEAVRLGLVPPELTVEHPFWYEPVALDRLISPTTIVGRLVAPRADSVDLSVRIGLGSNPSDTEFQELAAKVGVPLITTGQDGSTLAAIDLRTWYKSARSSLDRAANSGSVVTLKIVATAHYDNLNRKATTQVERKLVVLEDPDLMSGAPLRIGSTPTAPKLADVDNDGISDIVYGTLDGRVVVCFAKNGRVIEATTPPIQTNLTLEFETLQRAMPRAAIFEGTPAFPTSLGHTAIPSAPAIADLDLDGQPEIIAATADGHIYVVHADGTSPLRDGNPIELPMPPTNCGTLLPGTSCVAVTTRLERGISASPVVSDVNGDGRLDIVVAAHDGRVHAYQIDGESVPGWPVLIGAGSGMAPGRLTESPAVGDFDGDSIDDLLVTAGEVRTANFDHGLHVLVLGRPPYQQPVVADGWPVGVGSLDLLADRLDRSTPGSSVDSSSSIVQALLYGNSSQPFFLGLEVGEPQENGSESNSKLPSTAKPISQLDGLLGFDLSNKGAQSSQDGDAIFAPMLARPSIGDLDRDGAADIVLPGLTYPSLYSLRSNTDPKLQSMLALFSGNSGRMLPISPVPLEDFIGSASAAIADLTNDGFPEVIITNGSGRVLALDACGRSPPGWPKVVGSRISTAPAVDDIDGDGLLEVVATTDDGWLYVWRTQGLIGSYVPWPSALGDSYNRSQYSSPRAQTSPRVPAPLRLDEFGRCHIPETPLVVQTNGQLSARGGFGCGLSRSPSSSNHAQLSAMFGATAILLRRRRAITRRLTLCRRTDLNRRHRAYEARALTD